MTAGSSAAHNSPAFTFVEANWSLLSDCLMAYLRASSSEKQVAQLLQSWKALIESLRALSPTAVGNMQASTIAIAAWLSKLIPFPADAACRKLVQMRLMIELYRTTTREPPRG